MKMFSSRAYCALTPLFLLASSIHPQEKQGTVKIDALAVYSEMSPESDVVTTLPRGTVVRILLTVTGDDGNWCSIASRNGSSRIGYVSCSGLDRPKEILPAAAEGGSLPQILTGSAYTPTHPSKRQTPDSEEGSLVGQTLPPLSGYRWSSYPETLVIAVRRGCPYCDASLPFYRQLGDREKTSMLHAHVLLVMPDDASFGSSLLRKADVEVQGIFGQGLDALKVSGTPTVLLIDSSGRIEREWVGELTPSGEKDVMNAAQE
jgi:Bacterial SH3 domain